MTFEEFCDRLGHLRRDRSGGVPKPYKPLLVAAAVILVQKGKIRSRNVLLDGGLRSGFRQLLDALYPDWRFDAKPEYPFRHLETDGVWRLVQCQEKANWSSEGRQVIHRGRSRLGSRLVPVLFIGGAPAGGRSRPRPRVTSS